MYNYSSYPSLLLFRGDSDPKAKCPWDEDCPPNKEGCPHPGDRKGLNCWEFYGGGAQQPLHTAPRHAVLCWYGNGGGGSKPCLRACVCVCVSAGREEEDITFYMSTVAKGLNPFNEEAKLKPGLYKDAHGPVKDLDPDNFDATILDDGPDNNKIWIVEFYSDRCPICKGLVPEIKKAAETTMKEYPGEVCNPPSHPPSPPSHARDWTSCKCPRHPTRRIAERAPHLCR
jgi:hypothetical protein